MKGSVVRRSGVWIVVGNVESLWIDGGAQVGGNMIWVCRVCGRLIWVCVVSVDTIGVGISGIGIGT